MDSSCRLTLICCGRSLYDEEERIAGWEDPSMSGVGSKQMLELAAALRLAKPDFKPEVCFLSILKRAIQSWNVLADALDMHHVAVVKHWRLNDRHMGELQGKNNKELLTRYSPVQVATWLKSYDKAPPALPAEKLEVDPRLRWVMPQKVPAAEVSCGDQK